MFFAIIFAYKNHKISANTIAGLRIIRNSLDNRVVLCYDKIRANIYAYDKIILDN